MNNIIYTIVAGVNGAGKSTLTNFLKCERSDLGIIINVDKMSIDYNYDTISAGKKALLLINDCLSKKISFTQETTLSGKHTLKNISIAKSKGYYIRLYYVGLNTLDEHLKRIENRVAKGGHNIDKEDVIRRFNKRIDDLVPALAYCDEVHFYDNENGPIEIGEYRNGEIISKANNRPEWFVELCKAFESYNTGKIGNNDVIINTD